MAGVRNLRAFDFKASQILEGSLAPEFTEARCSKPVLRQKTCPLRAPPPHLSGPSQPSTRPQHTRHSTVKGREHMCPNLELPGCQAVQGFFSAVAQTESCRTSTQPSQKRTGVAGCASTSLQGFCSQRFSHARKLHTPSQCRCQEPPKWKRRRQPKLLTSPEAPAEAQDHT